jgi:hypothetical protein
MTDDTTPDEAAGPDDDVFTPDDTAGHEAAVAQYETERRERQAQLEQHLSVKERLEQEAAAQTQTVDVLGIDVEFERLPSDDELALVAIGERFQALGEDEIDRETLREMRDEVAGIIARNVHESMLDPLDDAPRMDDGAWWTQTLGLVELIMTGVALAEQNDEVTPDEVDEFR